jgi:hypothetical protein
MAISVASIYNLTRPGLRGIEGQYENIPTTWSQIFWQGKSNMGFEQTAEVRLMPMAQQKTEGSPTAMDNNAGVRFIYVHEAFEVGLGYAMTRKAISDNLYEQQFPTSNLALQNSFSQYKETQCAGVFNTGNVYNSAIGGDGVALFSASHPYDYGTWANTPATAQLSLNEGSLLSALTQIRTSFRDQAGLKFFWRGRRLIIHPYNEWVASRLIHTPLRPGTADNDINALRATGSLPDGYLVWDFLSSPYAWFVQTNEDGFLYLQREPFEMSMWVDDMTDNLLVKGYERFYSGYKNPRGAWGTFPTA